MPRPRRPQLTIGVHKRETDKALECEKVPAMDFFSRIDAIIAEHGKRFRGGVAIYLATDSDAALDEFRARYGDQARRRRRARAGLRLLAGGADARRRAAVPSQVVYREGAKRAAGEGDGAVHLNKGSGSGRAKVVDVVLDALLLGSCDFLIRTGSGVSMAAQAFSAPGQVVHYVHAGHC